MRVRACVRSIAAGVAVALGAVGATLPAHAAEGTADGQWWYELYDVPAAHAEGWTGDGVHIAVIDAQINPDLPVFADADLTVADGALCIDRGAPTSETFTTDASHGSTTTAMLVGNGQGAGAVLGVAPEASVTFYGWGGDAFADENAACRTDPEAEARGLTPGGWGVARALADGADIITTSVVSGSYSVADEEVIAEAIARGVVVVASTANSSGVTMDDFPRKFNGVVSVNAMDRDNAIQLDSDTGEPAVEDEVTVVAAGVDLSVIGTSRGGWDDTALSTGASFAAPIVAGMLALTSQKYPEAGGNQLIQSLIHNTWADDHPLERDGVYGYGAASLGHLLRVDPGEYLDVNPLMDKRSGGPTEAQVADLAAKPLPTATPAPAADESDGDGDPSGMPGLLVLVLSLVGVGVLLLIGGVILTVVLVRRSRSS